MAHISCGIENQDITMQREMKLMMFGKSLLTCCIMKDCMGLYS